MLREHNARSFGRWKYTCFYSSSLYGNAGLLPGWPVRGFAVTRPAREIDHAHHNFIVAWRESHEASGEATA